MDIVFLLNAQIRERTHVPIILLHSFVQPDDTTVVKICLLELVFQFEFARHRVFVQHALFHQGGADFGDVTRVVDAVIVEFLQHAEFVIEFSIKLAEESVRVPRHDERKIACPASDELRLGYRRLPDFALSRIALLITADNVKQVQHIPPFVQFLHGEDGTEGIVRILKRVYLKLVGVLFLLAVD